jgi:hypothetical protein
MGVHIWGPNRGPKSGSQIKCPKLGVPNWESQIGGPKLGVDIGGTSIFGYSANKKCSAIKLGSQIRVPNRVP